MGAGVLGLNDKTSVRGKQLGCFGEIEEGRVEMSLKIPELRIVGSNPESGRTACSNKNKPVPTLGISILMTLVQGGRTGYLIQIGIIQSCDVKGKEMNDKRDSGPRISLSLSLRKPADSTEVVGTMVPARDCLLKSKKGKYRDLSRIDLIVLAQGRVEPEIQGKTPTSSPLSRNFSWVVASGASPPHSLCYRVRVEGRLCVIDFSWFNKSIVFFRFPASVIFIFKIKYFSSFSLQVIYI